MNMIATFKFILALPVFIFFSLKVCGQDSGNLYGQWTLIEIENDTGKIKVPENKLFLIIAKDSLKYNLDVNNCWTNYQIDGLKIVYDFVACTQRCCDENYGSTINYSGEFEISNQKLKIFNNLGTYKLIKKE